MKTKNSSTKKVDGKPVLGVCAAEASKQKTKPEAFKFLRSEDPKFSMWTASNASYPLIEWMSKMERFAEQYSSNEFTKGIVCAVAIGIKCEGFPDSTLREMYGAIGCPDKQRLLDLGVDAYDIEIIEPHLKQLIR